MAEFTQLGLSKEPKKSDKNTPAGGKPRPHFNQNQKTTAFVSIVVAGTLAGIFLMLSGGCSKQESKPVASTLASPMVPNPAPTAALSVPSTTAQATTTAKKVAKKRPAATVAYNNQDYGLSFRFPRKYMLDPADKNSANTEAQMAMNFVHPGGVLVTRVEVPKDAYSGTDLTSAALDVNVNKLLTSDQCYQFAVPAPNSPDDPASPPAQVKLGGMEFEEVEQLTGPVTNQTDQKFYHIYNNDACYEFALGIETDSGSEDDLTPVNRAQVFGKLEKILATVKIRSEAVPDMTASTVNESQPTITKEVAK